MRKVRLFPWDPTSFLETSEDMADYLDGALDDALEDDDPGLIMAILEDIAHVRRLNGMTKDAELRWQTLKQSVPADGNPDLGTLLKIVNALGLRLAATTLPEAADAEASDAVEEAWAATETEAVAEADSEAETHVDAGTGSSDGETESIPAAAKVA